MLLEENSTHGLDVVPKGYMLTKEDMASGTYRQHSIKWFGKFLSDDWINGLRSDTI